MFTPVYGAGSAQDNLFWKEGSEDSSNTIFVVPAGKDHLNKMRSPDTLEPFAGWLNCGEGNTALDFTS